MLSNGKVLVVGGGNIVDGYLKSAELYDSVAGTWTATSNSMSDKRFAHAATLLSFLDGHESVLVSGGSSGGSNILASTELYDPVSDTWTTTGSLNHARMSHTATQLFDTQVLATGGSQSGNLSSAELYDPTPPLSAPATPVTISPNGNTNTEVSYLWYTSDGATSYELRVYTVSPVNKILDKIVDTSFCTAGVCTYHPANPLPVGAYYFQVSAGNGYTPGSYSIFSPARTFNTVANFYLSGNTGTGGVTLTYFDVKLRKAESDGNGNYSIPVSYDFSGTVIPSKTGYIFDPPSRNYSSTPVRSDLPGQDYTATALLLTVIPAGNGLGTVTSNPGGIDCGADCSELYNFNTSVTLTATPDISSLFTGWSGEGCSGTGTCMVSMTNARTVTATFTLKTFTVTVSPPTNGKVTSAPAGIDCGSDCSEIYNYGTDVTLTGVGVPGYTLGSWGGDCSGISDCTFTIQSDKSVTATFAVAQDLTLTFTGTGTGRVTSNPVKLNCSANCIVAFPQDTAVILTAHPAFGSIFIGWSGGLCSGTGTCSVTMSTARSVSAEFYAYNIIFLPLITR
jgi:hypothetical protein